MIEDEDLMFDGKPLNLLYEENRMMEGSRRSSGESERYSGEERRGRRRESRK